MKNRKWICLGLTAVLSLSLLAGCGSGDNESTAAGSTQSNPGGEDGVFTIAYAPNESTAESADARNGLAEDLGCLLYTSRCV